MAEENDNGEEVVSTGGKKKLLLLVLAVLILISVSVAVTFMLLGRDDSGEEMVEEEPPKEALYFSLDPAFVVNFQSDSGGSHHLQVTLDALTYDPEVYEAVRKHMPLIRNNLVLLFSRQKREELSTAEGKDQLRAAVLTEIQTIVETELGRPGVDEVFFSGFVMQ